MALGLMAASSREIQAAVRTLLDGGSAEPIMRLAGQSDDSSKKVIVGTAGVVPKLVEVLLRQNQAPESRNALHTLYQLVQIGKVAQDAIAQAHNGTIFAWLAGPQDHGASSYKDGLITYFTTNNPTNSVKLDTARGGVPFFAERILKSLQNGDTTTATLAMTALVNATREKGAASTIPHNSIVTLVSVLYWDPSSTDPQLSTIRDQVESLLVQLLHVEQVRQALARSPLGVGDLVKILHQENSDPSRLLLALHRLNHLMKANDTAALEIVSADAIPALSAAVRSTNMTGLLVDDLREQAARMLGELAQDNALFAKQVLTDDGAASLVILCNSVKPSHKTVALDGLRILLRDESNAVAFVQMCGVAVLFQLLVYNDQHQAKQSIPVGKILSSVFDGADNLSNEAYLRHIAERDPAITFLLDFLKGPSSASSEEIVKLVTGLGGLVPCLLLRLGVERSKPNGILLIVLKTLEHLARVPANQGRFQLHGGIERLTELLKTSTNPDEVTAVARVLANISCKNHHISELIIANDSTEQLVTMLNSNDAKIQTAALMALRNLSSNEATCVRIGLPDVIVRLIEVLSHGTMKQTQAATAVLGNAARMAANRKVILSYAGDEALFGASLRSQSISLVETATAALWVLTNDKDAIDRLRRMGGVAALQKVIGNNQPDQVPWATRLLQRLM